MSGVLFLYCNFVVFALVLLYCFIIVVIVNFKRFIFPVVNIITTSLLFLPATSINIIVLVNLRALLSRILQIGHYRTSQQPL